MRKDPLASGQVYHLISRSIAGYKVFPDKISFKRFIESFQFYNLVDVNMKFSKFDLLSAEGKQQIFESAGSNTYVDCISYTIMPTHPHLVLKQNSDNGISKLMSNLLNSYTRYFNIRFKRKGPLWETCFKNILVESDDQLLHLTRYVHLNPVSAGLADKPEDWQWSSYREFIGEVADSDKICDYAGVLDIDVGEYKKFVNDRIGYQKELSKIKKLLIDDYTG